MYQSNKVGRVLLVIPSRMGQGGVASFYSGVLPHFSKENTDYLEVGTFPDKRRIFHPVLDQIRFFIALLTSSPRLVHLNPSLGLKSFLRDGLFAIQARLLGVPFIVFWHGWDKKFQVKVDSKYRFFFNISFRYSKYSIVLASAFKDTLEHWGVKSPILRGSTNVDDTLLEGFNLGEKLSPVSQSGKNIKILFLARLEKDKGAFETIEAVKKLIDKNFSVSLTVAGDGRFKQDLEALASDLKFPAEKINFTGYIEGNSKIQAFLEHDIYCLPTSYGEGLPTSVLEAMAFGMPVVTSPVGGLADMFLDRKMGALVDGKKSDEIASAIKSLISDPEKIVKIGQFNAQYAREHFLGSVVAKDLSEIYSYVLKSSTASGCPLPRVE